MVVNESNHNEFALYLQPTAPQTGVQPPTLPGDNLDLPPVPQSRFPDQGASGGGDVDFDDLTRRFEELKRRK